MLYFFKLLFLLINIDQETFLNWFKIENPNNQNTLSQLEKNDSSIDFSTIGIEPSTQLSLDTFKLIIEGLWGKIQDGLTLSDI